jgi:hypothetical protein
MTVQNIDLSLNEYLELINNSDKSSDFIYRGQTNSYNNYKFTEWNIVSTYNRNPQFSNIRFNSFLTQQLNDSLFDIYYRNNQFVKDKKLEKSDLISKLYFLQHYGISTSLIDFTHNPFVALYFAMSSLNSHSGGTCDDNGFPNYYLENCTISIYQINYKLLVEKFKIQEINNKIGYEYDKKFKFNTNVNLRKTVHVGIDTNPIKNTNNLIDNFNLLKQEGAFIFYDNHYNKKYGLIEFITDYIIENKIEITEPLVKIYKIKYNELYKPLKSKQPNFKTAFQILKEKEKTGNYLFNDYQGLKYDLTFFHNQ